jgi:hypothetical protein
MFRKKVTLISPDGKSKIKILDTDEMLSERQIKRILKKADISEKEFIEACEKGDFD